MIARLLCDISLLVLSPIIYLIPKRKNVWLFGAWFGKSYSDDTRFLYEEALKFDQLKPIWISKNRSLVGELEKRNLPVYYAYSLRGIFFSMIAEYAFYTCGPTDINEYFISGTKRIQLWHGIPLKKILYDNNLQYPENLVGRTKKRLTKIARLFLPSKRQSWNLVISSTPVVSERMQSAFQVSNAKILMTGYPRHEYLLRKSPSSQPDIVLYAPTHRREGSSKFNELEFIEGLNLDFVDAKAKEKKVNFVIRLHHYHSGEMIREKIKNYKNIRLSERSEDIYDLLPRVKYLISDYSSVYLDFLVYNRPIVHYCFDLESYQKTDRGFYENFESNCAGAVFRDWTSVLNSVFFRKRLIFQR